MRDCPNCERLRKQLVLVEKLDQQTITRLFDLVELAIEQLRAKATDAASS